MKMPYKVEIDKHSPFTVMSGSAFDAAHEALEKLSIRAVLIPCTTPAYNGSSGRMYRFEAHEGDKGMFIWVTCPY